MKDISRLPDSVKELRTFDGNPTQYISWVHSVETILENFEIVRDKPIFRAIVQSIRQKIVGAADAALVSYNVFDSSWSEMKEVLSLHYADKRDLQTLEHQLNQLTQGSSSVDELYSAVNHQLSLIVNKIKTESYSEETVRALVETYRNRSLDVFIRGLKPDLSRMIIIQRPRTLPEAYSACLELQNVSLRNNITFPNRAVESLPAVNRPDPTRSLFTRQPQNFRSRHWYNPSGRTGNYYQSAKPALPPRRPAIKHEPMDVDRSIQSRRVNYINNPRAADKRGASGSGPTNKQPRLFHIENDIVQEQDIQDEVNFMAADNLVCPT